MTRWITLPKLGTNMQSAVVVKWLAKEGDHVEVGTPLVEVETDKASFTVESEAAGRLAALQAGEGEAVSVNDPLAAVLEAGETNVSPAAPPRSQATGADYLDRVRTAWRSSPQVVAGGAGPAMAPAARTMARAAGLTPESLEWAAQDAPFSADEVSHLLARPRAAIYGAGLGGKQILEVLRSAPGYLPVAFVDDDDQLVGTVVAGLPVMSESEGLMPGLQAGEIEAVFLSFHSEVRRKAFERLRERGVPMPPLVDGRAVVGHGVRLGDGCLIEAGTVIGPGVSVGEGAIVDIGSVVAHDCDIGAHCHLSPGACLSGAVELEDNVLIGVGVAVNSTVHIGRSSIVAPGSAVMGDLPADVVAMGVPASVVGESRRGR